MTNPTDPRGPGRPPRDDRPAVGQIVLRVPMRLKSACVRAAHRDHGRSLNDWATDVLARAVAADQSRE